MLAYPVSLQDDDGTILVTSTDFPELATFGDDEHEALERASDALEEAIAARIHDGDDIPYPSNQLVRGRRYASPSILTGIKALLYQGMRDRGIGKDDLAAMMKWDNQRIEWLLDVNHNSGWQQLQSALDAVGVRLMATAAQPPAGALKRGRHTASRPAYRFLRSHPRRQTARSARRRGVGLAFQGARRRSRKGLIW